MNDQTLIGAIEELSVDIVKNRESLHELTQTIRTLTKAVEGNQAEIADLIDALRRTSR